MPTAEAHKVAAEAVTLRRSNAHAPALDVLALICALLQGDGGL
jgi:hypothetical protein